MSPIELTDIHRSKLLEMGKSLFPEYEIEFIGNFSEWGVLRINRIEDHEIFEKIHHWFEFCNNWLSDKILANKITRTAKDKLLKYFWNNNLYWFKSHPEYAVTNVCEEALHPIDYLYEQFKQLKINK